MTKDEEISALKKLVFDFGNASADVIEQMVKGNWIDDHDHPVKNNTSIMALAMVLNAAANHVEKMNEANS